ncbi:hypothetical protein ACJX0J_010428, partial [Zea mays]
MLERGVSTGAANNNLLNAVRKGRHTTRWNYAAAQQEACQLDKAPNPMFLQACLQQERSKTIEKFIEPKNITEKLLKKNKRVMEIVMKIMLIQVFQRKWHVDRKYQCQLAQDEMLAQRTTEEEVEKNHLEQDAQNEHLQENLRNAIFRAISIVTREAQHEKKGTYFFWANENLVDLLQVIPIVTNKFIVDNQIDENNMYTIGTVNNVFTLLNTTTFV